MAEVRARSVRAVAAVGVLLATVSAVVAPARAVAASTAGRGASAVPGAVQQQCGTSLSSASPALSVDPTSVPASGPTTVTVRGSGYLTGPYRCDASKYGGVYVLFGWVQPGQAWGPSNRESTSPRGQYGSTYVYPGAGGGGETRDDGSGTVRLVAFTPGGTSGSETAFHMDPAGNWSTTITVAPSFSWSNVVTGESRSIDCTKVQCGVFTIGAHGIASATNELFVPVSFAATSGTGNGSSSQQRAPSASASGGAGSQRGAASSGTDAGTAGSATAGSGTVGSAGSGASAGTNGSTAHDGANVASGRSTAGDGSSGSDDATGSADGTGSETDVGGSPQGDGRAGASNVSDGRSVGTALSAELAFSHQVFEPQEGDPPWPWLAAGLVFAVVLTLSLRLLRRSGTDVEQRPVPG